MIIVAAKKTILGIKVWTVFLELVLLSLLPNGHRLVVFNNRVEDIAGLRGAAVCTARGRLNIPPEEAFSTITRLIESACLIGMHWCTQLNPVQVWGLIPTWLFLNRHCKVASVGLADRTRLSQNDCRR